MLNSICVQGRLTRDIELRYTASQVAVASFTIACDRDFKSKEGDRETDWIDIVAWNSSAEFVNKYFRKGDMIVIQGRLQTRTYEDKNGNKRKAVEVVGTSFNFCGKKDGGNGGNNGGQNLYNPPQGGQGYGGTNQNAGNHGGYGNQQMGSGAYGNGQQGYGASGNAQYGQGGLDDFMRIPDGIDESLPFT